ncbi:hypothetical protein ANCDUO_09818 [Ancylostoma duodenale]|uniref:Uncharacterized protein n=1 Tax=Ancylostoma duodenale TaxID=51022 RepID=A0A0C2CSV3_9BILA|nr:hypothetical protein ANCDUO_09818 [Ancylostoma duodenale]
MIVRDGLDINRTGPLTLEWAPPAVKINFPQVQQTPIKKLKAKIAALKKVQMKTSEKAARPAPGDAAKKPPEVPTKPAAEIPTQLSSKRKTRPAKTLERSVEQTKGSKEHVTEAKSAEGLKGSARGRKQVEQSPRRAPAVRKVRSKEGLPNRTMPTVGPRRMSTARRPGNGGKARRK